jgi:phage terminase large subunit GpA-like protein
VRGESWVVDLRRRPADPAASAEDWDAMLVELLGAAWPLADGSGRVMRLRVAGYDSAGAPGVTAQAYDAWRRFFARRKLRMLGRFDGREAWNLMPAKGLGGANAAPLSVVRPDTMRKDRAVRAGGAVPIAQFNANWFKDALMGQLARGEPGGGYVHFPAELRAAEAPHPFFEQLVAETRKPNGVWEKTRARNEALDLMVGAHVLAHLNGLARINWDRPPSWAAAWDHNALIGPPESVRAAPPPAVSPALELSSISAARPADRIRSLVSRLA